MRHAGAALAVVVLFAGAFVLGQSRSETPPPPPAAFSRLPAVPDLPEPLIEQVRSELQSGYYRPVGFEVLGEESVAEVIDALDDPYTEYLSATQYHSLKNRTARSYSGVGLTVGPAREGLIVTSALVGPAREAGIRRGDVILSIDGKRARKLPFERSLALIKGEEGTLVRLTVRRPDRGVIRFTVVRQEVAVPSIRSRLVRVRGSKLGYVRLLTFSGNVSERLGEATDTLLRRGAKGLILDLRDNPGGLLREAVRSASLYLDEGVVCTVEGEHQARRVYEASGNAAYPSVPLAVIVNGGSASAAEILAAALRDHGRAIVVGRRTYGKTSVQSIRELSNGAALKLTTATYETPARLDLSGRGLDPAIRALDDPLTTPDEAVVVAERTLLKRLR